MPENLSVRLNHDQLHDIETSPAFETTDSFPVVLRNGDAPIHVHLSLNGPLSDVASLSANNHFVDANAIHRISVEVESDPRPVEGQLEIVVGHGVNTDHVPVSIVEPDGDDAVDVDTTLSEPPEREPDDDPPEVEVGGISLTRSGSVIALGVFALTVALSSALLSNSPAVLGGALVVLGSVAIAVYMLAR